MTKPGPAVLWCRAGGFLRAVRAEGLGQLAPRTPLYAQCTRSSLGRAARTVPWRHTTTGYEDAYEQPAQHIVPQLETEQPLRTSSTYW